MFLFLVYVSFYLSSTLHSQVIVNSVDFFFSFMSRLGFGFNDHDTLKCPQQSKEWLLWVLRRPIYQAKPQLFDPALVNLKRTSKETFVISTTFSKHVAILPKTNTKMRGRKKNSVMSGYPVELSTETWQLNALQHHKIFDLRGNLN